MELLEREQFLSELDNLLNHVTSGDGRFVLVSGEAGIGKTSLVERFVDTHHKQARVLWGSCDALFTPRPLGPVYDIAHQTKSNLLSLLQSEASRSSIFSAVLNELENPSAPTIAVIEDVHWADEATLDLLKFLGRRINRTSSLLILTYRDDEVGPVHPLRLLLGDLPNRSVVRLRLPPLSEIAVSMLAERVGRRADDLYAVTGGNPFFVTEALASEESGVPVTVRDAVISRAARLSNASRAMLELVSVVPSKTEMWLLEATINPEASILDECLSAGILRLDGEAIAFRHELARRTIEDSIGVTRRQTSHALALKSLLNHDCEALLPRIVHHAAKAGDSVAVLNYAPLAAKQAGALNAHRQAASHYETALQYADALAPEERAALLECRSYECYLTDQMEEALQARREALEIWTKLGNKRRQGDTLRWLSRITWFLGQKRNAEAYSIEATNILDELPPGPELAMAYSNRSQLHMLAEEIAEAELWGSRAIELAHRFGATETLAHALNNVGTAQLFAHNEQGRIRLQESLSLSLENNFQEHAARAFTNLATIAVRERNYQMARQYLDDGITYTNDHDLESWTLYMMVWRARTHFEQGDWDKAADDAAFVLSHSQLAAITKIHALAVLGYVRVRRGDPEAARLLKEAHELAVQTGEPQRLAPVTFARAEFAWLRGELAQLIEEARSDLKMPAGYDDPWLKGEFAFWMWRAGAAPETHEKIAEPYALLMSGQWAAAAEAWRRIGCPYEEAMALAEGDESARRAALEIFGSLGARPAAEHLRHELRAIGVRGIPRGPRSSTKENVAGLTNREMEVLGLMVMGLSNTEIASRLFISPKTTDHHVSAILTKLDSRTRVEAVSRALHSGLIKSK